MKSEWHIVSLDGHSWLLKEPATIDEWDKGGDWIIFTDADGTKTHLPIRNVSFIEQITVAP